MEIKGVVEKIIFMSPTWASILISGVPRKIRENAGLNVNRDIVSARGNIINPVEKTVMVLQGDFITDPKFGIQFETTVSEIVSNDEYTIINYLASSFVKGCGEKMAKQIYDEFGSDTFRVIEYEPEKLTALPGIGKKKAEGIHESFMETQSYRKIVEYFNGRITPSKAIAIYKRYGSRAISVLEHDPYQTIYDIKGFGFKISDKLALAKGMKLDDIRRVRACLLYVLELVADNKGHCYINIDELAMYLRDLINNAVITDQNIIDRLMELVKANKITLEEHSPHVRIYPTDLYQAELDVAKKIVALKREGKPYKYDEEMVKDSIYETGVKSKIIFEPLQELAVKNSLKSHVSIITGGPGTGKTTVVKGVVDAAKKMGMKIICLAPTGRAARKLAESTKEKAMTLSLFTYKNADKDPEDSPNTLYIVDEASMIDIDMAATFLNMVDTSSIVVFVGDIDQLPSIGAGNFFRDLVSGRAVTITKLQISHRFSGSIAMNAKKINRGDCSLINDKEFIYIKEKDYIARRDMLINQFYSELSAAKNDITKVQIIVPKRTNGECSSDSLNKIIREAVNPHKRGEPLFGAKKFRLHDRVMQTKNNRNLGVSNGDCGLIVDITGTEMTVCMDTGDIITYSIADADNLVIAYAVTVHKSQGSEYDTVIMALGSCDYIMLQRNLLYTAVTRAKKKMILIADPSSVYSAVNNINPVIRNTSLVEKIKELETKVK